MELLRYLAVVLQGNSIKLFINDCASASWKLICHRVLIFPEVCRIPGESGVQVKHPVPQAAKIGFFSYVRRADCRDLVTFQHSFLPLSNIESGNFPGKTLFGFRNRISSNPLNQCIRNYTRCPFCALIIKMGGITPAG